VELLRGGINPGCIDQGVRTYLVQRRGWGWGGEERKGGKEKDGEAGACR